MLWSPLKEKIDSGSRFFGYEYLQKNSNPKSKKATAITSKNLSQWYVPLKVKYFPLLRQLRSPSMTIQNPPGASYSEVSLKYIFLHIYGPVLAEKEMLQYSYCVLYYSRIRYQRIRFFYCMCSLLPTCSTVHCKGHTQSLQW